MILFGSTPQLAAMTTFGSACSIRVHSSLAAKPKSMKKILIVFSDLNIYTLELSMICILKFINSFFHAQFQLNRAHITVYFFAIFFNFTAIAYSISFNKSQRSPIESNRTYFEFTCLPFPRPSIEVLIISQTKFAFN